MKKLFLAIAVLVAVPATFSVKADCNSCCGRNAIGWPGALAGGWVFGPFVRGCDGCADCQWNCGCNSCDTCNTCD